MNTAYHWDDGGKGAIDATSKLMQNNNFSPFVMRGSDFVSSTQDNDVEEPHIGQYRVRFHYNSCGPATIMAQ